MKKSILLILVLVLGPAVICPAAEDTWTRKADMPMARNVLSTCVVDGKLYTIGGGLNPTTGSWAVAEYDPATNRWTQRGNLPEATCGLSTSVIDGKIYAIGGATSAVGVARSSVYIYDPETDTWTNATALPTPRKGFNAVVINDEIYAIGGSDRDIYFTVNEKYTPSGYIPEFPSWTILPFVLIISVFLVVVKRKLYARNPKLR